MKVQNKLSLRQGLSWILLSVFLVAGSATLCFLYYQYVKGRYSHNKAYQIVAIVQTTADKEPLKTAYLAELLELSIDRPTNLYRFNAKEARRRLLASPVIKQATVKKIRPGTVYVDYTLRRPIALLLDYANAAVDEEGVIFPFRPFFTPKYLPEIFLGLPKEISIEWGNKIQNKGMEQALLLLKELTKDTSPTQIQRIDVSRSEAPSRGQRQIVIVEEERVELETGGHPVLYLCPYILRLNPDNYMQELERYRKMKPYLIKNVTTSELSKDQLVVRYPPTIIDLRVSSLAFLKNG